jgi:hypothetical protein
MNEEIMYTARLDRDLAIFRSRVFFENWYGYWHDALLHDGGIDWIQFLAVITYSHSGRQSCSRENLDE